MSVSFEDICNLVARHIPDGCEIEINLENGAGGVVLYMDDYETKIEGHLLDDSSMETQIVELVKFAKGEPSDYDDLVEKT